MFSVCTIRAGRSWRPLGSLRARWAGGSGRPFWARWASGSWRTRNTYREDGYRRDLQNFVGESTISGNIVHLIGCPPSCLRDMMEGLESWFTDSEGLHPVLRAAAISFPFVFIHPFEDGNGRIHRYLIHDIMARGDIGGEELLIPVSAGILADLKTYDTCLEHFSKPLLAVAEYHFDEDHEMVVENPEEIEGFYRYPDLTPQAEYLARMVKQAIQESLTAEVQFLDRFDRVCQGIEEIVSMPNRKRDALINRLYCNQGKLSRRRREGEFKELTDSEIEQIEVVFAEVFDEK